MRSGEIAKGHPEDSLAQVRERIDAIDDSLHALLMERTKLVESVSDAKSGSNSPVYRPGREADILRRLIDRHDGQFPLLPLVLIWRQIISVSLGLQREFVVAVNAAEDTDARREIALAHFGAATPITLHGSVAGVFVALTQGTASVGILPFPAEGQDEPWWPRLMQYGEGLRSRDCLSVVARLPFAPSKRQSTVSHDSLVIAMQAPEPTAQDRSLVVVKADTGTSRARVNGAFKSRGLEPRLMLAHRDEVDPEATLFLLEVDGFIGREDHRVSAIGEEIGAEDPVMVQVLGAYAEPFAAKDIDVHRGVNEP